MVSSRTKSIIAVGGFGALAFFLLNSNQEEATSGGGGSGGGILSSVFGGEGSQTTTTTTEEVGQQKGFFDFIPSFDNPFSSSVSGKVNQSFPITKKGDAEKGVLSRLFSFTPLGIARDSGVLSTISSLRKITPISLIGNLFSRRNEEKRFIATSTRGGPSSSSIETKKEKTISSSAVSSGGGGGGGSSSGLTQIGSAVGGGIFTDETGNTGFVPTGSTPIGSALGGGFLF